MLAIAAHRCTEERLAQHPSVADCALIGAAGTLEGQVPFGFVVLKASASDDHHELVAELIALVRSQIGPVASFRNVYVLDGCRRPGRAIRASPSRPTRSHHPTNQETRA